MLSDQLAIVLAVSVSLPLLAAFLAFRAAFLAFRVAKMTGWHIAWVAVSAALLVMVLRRLTTLYRLLSGESSLPPELSAELVALTISLLLVVGVAWIAVAWTAPLFASAGQNEDALRQSEASLANAQRLAHLGSWEWDIVTNTVRWSDEIHRIFGLRPQEFGATYEAFLKSVHPDDRGMVENAVRRTLHEGVPYDIEFRILRPDGGERIVHAQAEVTRREAGKPIRMSGTAQDVTDRRRTEDALRASQQMLQMVLDTIPARVFWKDRDSTYLGCNLRFAEDAGLAAPEEIIGRNDHELPWAEHAELYRGDDRAVILSGVPKLAYEEPLTRPDGTRRWLRTSKIPLRSQDGNIMGVLGCYEDITEQKRAEVAHRESEARLRAITNALPDLVFLLDQDGRFIEFLTVQEEFRYAQPEAIKGKLASEVLPKDVAERLLEAARRTLESGQPQTLEYSLKVRGERPWFEARTAPMELPANGTRVVAVVSRDITDRKRAETLNMRLGRIIEHSVNEIYVFDSQSLRFVQVNQGARENLGYSLEELQELTPLDLKPEFTREAFEDLIKPLRDGTRDQIVFQTFHRRKDGSTYEVEVLLQLMRTETPPVFVAIIQDVTERKAVEEQLRHAQKMEAVGQLTGGIAHDFNNLLTVILGNLDLVSERLGRRKDSADLRRLVAQSVEAADRGSVLTQRLLAFSRKQVLEPQLVDVNALVAGMLDLLRRPLGRDIEIEFLGADDLWACEADPGQLENSLLNLVINARDAMPDGGRITIETANADVDEAFAASHGDAAPGRYVTLSVSDTGTGIPAEALEHVFEPFFTTKDVGEGSGLGLSMIYGFVKQSGGFVTISSRESQGTTVTVYLPRADGAASHRSRAASRQRAPSGAGLVRDAGRPVAAAGRRDSAPQRARQSGRRGAEPGRRARGRPRRRAM